MNLQEVIKLIESDYSCDLNEIKLLFLKVADNILKNPDILTYKSLKKTNALVSKKILATRGGSEMLLLMGFKETNTDFVFPSGTLYISKLENIRHKLANWKPVKRKNELDEIKGTAGTSTSESRSSVEYEIIVRPVVLPPLVHKYTNPFLRKVTETFHQALVYANKEMIENARRRIPLVNLEINAQKKMRDLQEQVKEGKTIDPPISIQDLVLVELLKWFKEEFFTWVDAPDCIKCGKKPDFSHENTDQKLMLYTNRVEIYKCSECDQLTPFPRYNDLNILLETRKGRCGEWANCFTLMCHAMGWDARLVVDETDHVWTEVYSPIQKRWIHCDPCENVCDTPLMYEQGWKKPLSYVMAYSPEELQDVTWRYSSNHTELLKKRYKCREEELVKAIIDLRNERLKTLPPARRDYILKRCVGELAELLIERQPKDEEMHGRSSGSLDWRVARGETTESPWTPETFELFDSHLENMKYVIRYSCASDKYEAIGSVLECSDHWISRIYNQNNMMRKVEHDWKKVYLCRKEGADEGYIAWKVVLKNTQKKISSVFLKLDSEVFENGRVDVKLTGDNGIIVDFPAGNLTTMDFQGSQTLLIEAHISGGRGKEAWQHAQLFRQSIESNNYTFELLLTFQ